ncbi:MAG: DinB family protein [Desulfomonilia bacterium]|uniref:DinB superfamily protein n=1 Tax=anaerobic digester metagenome TaxID=1263854 RepID=A0A485LXJ3_9ZZZZ|nr:DinB family protein [Pseudomonadota bacterium]HON38928.1 DinB family protein [Deltaproteobacteria bacterium]HPD21011.1 DinB family protein [Deltaproteobacteria bacterium]HRS55806.1 DinB family protein [Desulfomonilia bacterium]HRV34511.1 DinB family protein [Desulfomonilia bacterium]
MTTLIDRVTREQLIALLEGGNAHMSFDKAVEGFPLDRINTPVPQGSYLIWHLLFHMQVVQWDILEFVRNPGHISPDFPGGYWPHPGEQASPAVWVDIANKFRADLEALKHLVRDPRTDFFSPIPHAKEYTVLREILLAADHNAFHVGELVCLRRVLNLNPVKEY